MDTVAGKAPPSLLPRCGACGLLNHCQSPKIPIYGEGLRKILIIGEAPGKGEDYQNKPFVGKAGQYLRGVLNKFNVDMKRDCWVTNSLICWPHTPEGKNRTPTDNEIDYCRPNLIKAITELQPEIIIPLGSVAVSSLLGWVWRSKDIGTITRWDGWRIPCQKLNAWICPTWHPSYVIREDESQDEEYKDSAVRQLFLERRIKAACQLKGRPWKEVPNWDAQVQVVLDSDVAAEKIRAITTECLICDLPAAFDYETDRLKPDSKDSQIVCCSISNGMTTFAFPWYGKAKLATQEFIQSDVGKIASNAKFEERWTRLEFGHGVNNWVFDTMLAAHALDTRAEITSIKFQAFVLLGVESWDEHIKPFFSSKGNNERSKIKTAPITSLLKYCGKDSLYEFKVARRQMKQLGML